MDNQEQLKQLTVKQIHFRIRKIIALLCLLIIATPLFSQEESVIYIGTNGKITSLDHAIFMKKITTSSQTSTMVTTYSHIESKWGKISTEKYKKVNDSTYQIRVTGEKTHGTTMRIYKKVDDKLFKFIDMAMNSIIRTGYANSIVPLLLQGEVTEYYITTGNKKSVSQYSNNELISNENWYENGEPYIDNIFYSADSEPTFKPGNKVLHESIMKGFKDAGINPYEINGSITIGFVIMEDGTIDGFRVIKKLGNAINSIGNNISESIIAASTKGNWTPAKLNNKTVRYFQVFPINFIINQKSFRFAEISNSGMLNMGY